MNRRALALGLGIALTFIAAPVAAQSVYVDVGVHAGPIAGRVVYGAPVVYADHGGYGVDSHVHHPVHGHRYVKHGHRRHHERQYHKRVHRRDWAYARAHGMHSHYCRH